MSSHRLRRVVGVLSSSVLLFLLLAPAAVTAADTRQILVFSPGELDGELKFSPTSPGGLTAVDVTITNNGGQTINAIRLLGGTAADDAPVNPLFEAPPKPSLPDGAAYVAAFPACDIPDGETSLTLTCDVGTLRKGRSVTYRVIIETPTTAGTNNAWFGVYVAEGNATGTNQDNFYAAGQFTTATATCVAASNKNANYFLPGSKVDLDSAICAPGTGQNQNASIASGQTLGGNGAFASLQVEDTYNATCPTSVQGVTGCYGNTVDVVAGATVPGGLQWSITWYGTRSLAGVIHHLDNGTPVVIFFNKKSQCSANKTTDCWVTTSASKGNETPSWFSATFVTPGNGKGSGFY